MKRTDQSPAPPPPQRVLIALGSNLGDSPSILRAAIGRLAGFSTAPVRCSSVWQTTPVDCPPDSPPFLNAAVSIEPPSTETPETLLDRLQALERAFGRRPKEILNEPRPLDLDLIAYGGEIRATPRLVLPHPRACQRRFVLAPLAEIEPDFRFPGQDLTISQILDRLESDEVVQRLEASGGSCFRPGS